MNSDLYDPAEERAVRRDLIAENLYTRLFVSAVEAHMPPHVLETILPAMAARAYNAAEILMAEGDRRRKPPVEN